MARAADARRQAKGEADVPRQRRGPRRLGLAAQVSTMSSPASAIWSSNANDFSSRARAILEIGLGLGPGFGRARRVRKNHE
jgi:hypothetical protein